MIRHGTLLLSICLIGTLLACPRASGPGTSMGSGAGAETAATALAEEVAVRPSAVPIDPEPKARDRIRELLADSQDMDPALELVPWPSRDLLVDQLEAFPFLEHDKVRPFVLGVYLIEGFQPIEREDGTTWEKSALAVGTMDGGVYLLFNVHNWPAEPGATFPFTGSLHHELFHAVDFALFPDFIDDLHAQVCPDGGEVRPDGMEAWCASGDGAGSPSCRRLEVMRLYFDLPPRESLPVYCEQEGAVAYSRAWTSPVADFITGTAPVNTFENVAETMSIYWVWTRYGVVLDKQDPAGRPVEIGKHADRMCSMVDLFLAEIGLSEDCATMISGGE